MAETLAERVARVKLQERIARVKAAQGQPVSATVSHAERNAELLRKRELQKLSVPTPDSPQASPKMPPTRAVPKDYSESAARRLFVEQAAAEQAREDRRLKPVEAPLDSLLDPVIDLYQRAVAPALGIGDAGQPRVTAPGAASTTPKLPAATQPPDDYSQAALKRSIAERQATQRTPAQTPEQSPVLEAIGDTLRGLASPEMVAITAGLAAAPALAPLAGPVFLVDMFSGAYDAQAEMESQKRQAASARADGDEAKALQHDAAAQKASTQKWIGAAFAGTLGAHTGKTAGRAAADVRSGLRAASTPELPPLGRGDYRQPIVPKEPIPGPRLSQVQRRATVEVPETGAPPDAFERLSEAELEALTRPEVAEPAPVPTRSQSGPNPEVGPPEKPPVVDLPPQAVEPAATVPSPAPEHNPAVAALPTRRTNPDGSVSILVEMPIDALEFEAPSGPVEPAAGPLSPIEAVQAADGAVDVIDGRKRVEAARQAGMRTVPSYVSLLVETVDESGNKVRRRAVESDIADPNVNLVEPQRRAPQDAQPESAVAPEMEAAPVQPQRSPESAALAEELSLENAIARSNKRTAMDSMRAWANENHRSVRPRNSLLLKDRRLGSRPLSIVENLIKRGGLVDFGGEIAAMEFESVPFRKNLIQKKGGMELDAALISLQEDGYYTETATEEMLLEDIGLEARGRKKYQISNEGMPPVELPLALRAVASPGRIADAIAKGKGALFEKVRKAFEDEADALSREEMDARSKPEDLPLFEGAGPGEVFAPGESDPTLGLTPEEGMEILARGRPVEQLRESKRFDSERLVNSPLFEGRGGPQQFLGTDVRAEAAAPSGPLVVPEPSIPPAQALRDMAYTSDRVADGTVYTISDARHPEYNGRQIKSTLVRGKDEYAWMPESASRMGEAIALSSPSGRMSGRARTAAEERLRGDLFGPDGLQREPVAQPSAQEANLRRAAELRGIAARGQNPRKNLREAERLEAESLSDSAEPSGDVDLSFEFEPTPIGQSMSQAADHLRSGTNEKVAELKTLFSDIASGKQLGANLPVQLLGKFAEVGVRFVGEGALRFGAWSARMIAEFGDVIRPHLAEIWRATQERHAAIKDFKVEDYLNLKRINVSPETEAELRASLISSVIETGRVPKDVETWKEVQDRAFQMGGEEAVRQLKQAEDALPRYRAAMDAARQTMNAMAAKLVEMRAGLENLTGDALVEALERVDQLERDFSNVESVVTPTKSQYGRDLNILRRQADATWDISYWLSKARSSVGIPPHAALPSGIQAEIMEIAAAGTKAHNAITAAAGELGAAVDAVVETIGGSQRQIPSLSEGITPPDPVLAAPPPRPGLSPAGVMQKDPLVPTADTKPVLHVRQPELIDASRQGPLLPELEAGEVGDVRGTQPQIPEVVPPGKPLPELTGAIEKIRGLQDELVDISQTAGRPLPELTGAIEKIRGLQQELLDARVVTPEFETKWVGAIAGVQKAIGDLRDGMVELDKAKRKMARKQADLQKTPPLEVLTAAWKAGLMGVLTTARNLGGTQTFQALTEASKLGGAIIDMTRVGAMDIAQKAGVGPGGERRIATPSAGSISRSIRSMGNTGFREFAEVMRQGATETDLRISGVKRETNSGIPWVDRAINTQFRFIGGQDRIPKAYAFRRALEDRIWLEASKTGTAGYIPSDAELTAAVKAQRFGQLAQHNLDARFKPSAEMILESLAEADLQTFNNSNIAARALGEGLRYARREGGPFGQVFAAGVDVLAPFTNTPANVTARAFEYTPPGVALNVVESLARAAYRGKITGRDGRPWRMRPNEVAFIEKAIARGAIGTALTYIGMKAYESGVLTGSFQSDEGARAIEEARGRTPGSLNVGAIMRKAGIDADDRWVNVAQITPLFSNIIIGANMARMGAKDTDVLLPPTGMFLNRMLDQPMVSGLGMLSRIPGRENLEDDAVKRMASGILSSVVPAYIAEIAQSLDPYARNVRSDSLLTQTGLQAAARIPFMRTWLDRKKTVAGDDMAQGAYFGTPGKENATARLLAENGIKMDFPAVEIKSVPNETLDEYQARTALRWALVEQKIRNTGGLPANPDARKEGLQRFVDESSKQAIRVAADPNGRLDRLLKARDALKAK